MHENEHGKRKRSLDCARDDDTRQCSPRTTFIPLREPTSAPSGHLLPREGGRMPLHGLLMKMGYDTRIPFPHIRHFERKREIFFVRGKAKAVRGAASGTPPCSLRPEKTVFHADRSTQEKEHGKRKRSLGCARDDDTRIPLPRTTFIPLRCQPPPLRGTSFQGKERECRFTSSSYRWLTIRECRSPAFVAHTRFFIGL